MNVEQVVDHDDLDQALRRCGSTWGAAQAHGFLCSRLAVSSGSVFYEALAAVLDGCDRSDALCIEAESLLAAAAMRSGQELDARQSEFVPLLPSDDSAAAEKAAALGEWCEGFLHGLVGGVSNADLKSTLAVEPMSEIIKDFLEITRATTDPEDAGDESEAAYTELVEYLRAATQLTFEELVEFRREPEAPAQLH